MSPGATDYGKIHAETRERVAALLERLDDDQLRATVPACPLWTVKDVAAHLSGLTTDLVEGKLDGYGTDGWTNAQVRARRSWDLQQVTEEWARSSAQLEPLFSDPDGGRMPPVVPVLAVSDLAVHEHDIRGAVGIPGARDSTAVEVGTKSYIADLRQRFSAEGLPTLRIVTDDRDWLIGRDEPAAAVRADAFELFRALAGRRTREQVLAWDWDGDAKTYADKFLSPHFSWPEVALVE